MAEISREDAYDISENELSMLGESDDLAKFIRKAISDMQKLEKIEQIIKNYQDCTDIWKGMDEAYVVGEIEQILNE